MKPIRLILASASARRKHLLAKAGVSALVYPVNIDESVKASEPATAYVERMALEKMQAAKQVLLKPPLMDDYEVYNCNLLSADTIVSVDGQILTKPLDFADAKRMWQLLSGRSHEVMTAFCVSRGEPKYPEIRQFVVKTLVEFRPIHEDEMQAYWDTQEPQDKAGAYAIQGHAQAWCTKLTGSRSNVIGLPVAQVLRELSNLSRIDIS